MTSWSLLAPLPLDVATLRFEERSLAVSPAFTRQTTTVCLVDESGRQGRGEDVTYSRRDHERLRTRGPVQDVAGSWTLESFSAHLDGLALFAEPPEQEASFDYRRWAFESAALALALRQAGRGLAEVLGRSPEPLRFVASARLPDASLARIAELREAYPGLRFKLDLEESWTRGFVRELHGLGCVDTIDLKGMYEGTSVDLAPDAQAYAMVAEELPDAWIEDPRLNGETRAALAPHLHRVTWDAPIHSVADVDALEEAPRCLNCKPSRFGTLERLFGFYEACRARGIRLYAGGQFELGVGREQIQALAALFHPDAPNDCAPGGFNVRPVPAGLPRSPMVVRASGGFAAAGPSPA